jgi:predicted DNA-binding transcriptional regulator AlpA
MGTDTTGDTKPIQVPSSQLPAGQLYLSPAGLAKRYSVTRRTIWNWVKAGHLPEPERLPGTVRRWLVADIVRIEEAARAAQRGQVKSD